MATFNKIPLSGSTNGKGILVAATATPGTLIHTAGAGTTNFDEVWLYASNNSLTSTKLTVEYGGTTSADQIEISIPGESGLVLVSPGLVLNNGLSISAFAGTANVISIFSNAYTNVPVNYYNGYWQPWQTTLSNNFSVLGDNVLNYTNFNFVGIEFSSPTVNANSMTHIHLDAFIPGPIAPGRQLRVIVVDLSLIHI